MVVSSRRGRRIFEWQHAEMAAGWQIMDSRHDDVKVAAGRGVRADYLAGAGAAAAAIAAALAAR
jgi:hypothetical protein